MANAFAKIFLDKGYVLCYDIIRTGICSEVNSRVGYADSIYMRDYKPYVYSPVFIFMRVWIFNGGVFMKYEHFTANYIGLSDAQVAESRAKHGTNEQQQVKRPNFFLKALGLLREPMFLLLFATAFIYFLLDKADDGLTMLFFVVVIAFINLFQEWRTDKTLDALKELSSPEAKVLRGGKVIAIKTHDLVVGDYIIVEEGDILPADCQILQLSDLGVDESMLTGESDVVWKSLAESGDYWKSNQCYSGTLVVQGSALLLVQKIGQHTEFGKIGKDIAKIQPSKTPLEKQTASLIKICAAIGVFFFLIVFLVNFNHSSDVKTALIAGLTIAMAMIPEEFPVILTVFLALGAARLAKKNALIKKMPACETLGSISVLCVDKTGTLTQNKMTVKSIFTNIGDDEFMLAASRACELSPYEPMEKAILEYAGNPCIQGSIVREYPFSTDTKVMGHVWDDGCLYAKGSPESIVAMCSLDLVEKQKIENEIDKMAKDGLRVIAVATAENCPNAQKQQEITHTFIGLIGLYDPPREAVPSAVEQCCKAGIRVVMITGDHAETARAIAKRVGISADAVITGGELESLSDTELAKRVAKTCVFARVIPSQKMRIVKALQQNGEVVAMTGDGINDAPALKLADIGIAMGKKGTAVSKEAADLVILDDNFTTIVDTIKDGRRIYDNIKKAVAYCFVVHIPIALMAFLAPLLHLPLMLLPIHVVFLELIIDPTCSIIFERLPAEADIMLRKPRGKDKLVSRGMLIKSVVQGLVILAAVLGAYVLTLDSGEESARSMAMAILVLSNLWLVYVNRSERSIFARQSLDKVAMAINLAVVAGLALLLYLPPLRDMAGMATLPPTQLAIAFAVAFCCTVWYDVVKAVRSK